MMSFTWSFTVLDEQIYITSNEIVVIVEADANNGGEEVVLSKFAMRHSLRNLLFLIYSGFITKSYGIELKAKEQKNKKVLGCCGHDPRTKLGQHVPHPIFPDICMCCGQKISGFYEVHEKL